ncbi:MAG: hypothetical protein A3H98_06450 [Bacteroidetes bacterium RIFCSPLOWO2_02_FULL_36_8]|nr:MAG: hypothetical protein A3H98_06450 [Bacteroidetes bacterium RIFCSPLOWO2_02_FULL_36_8]OFY71105.1 MAG: hypothetical protein A3G23_14955 [Bacteroidetes bacterium RIFCSPLOWO2_12_FULL_37_12]
MQKTLLTLCILSFPFLLNAQAGTQWNWPENKMEAQKQWSLFSEYLKQGESNTSNPDAKCTAFRDAATSFRWLLVNCPNLENALYVRGVALYKGLADCSNDAKMKTALQDSALLLYDMRINYFGDTANILNRKAVDAMKWKSANTNDMYELLKKTIHLNGNSTFFNNLSPFMEVLCKLKKDNKITEEEVLEEYEKMAQIIEFNISKGEKVSNWESTKENLDRILFSCVNIDCDRVKTTLGPKFHQNPEDLLLAKKVFHFMKTGKCTEDPLFLEASKSIYKSEPSPDLAAIIGLFSMLQKDFTTAIEYFNKAIETATDEKKKADYYYRLAESYKSQGNKSTARTMARKALSIDPDKKDVFTLIGFLYMTSGDECKTDNGIKDKAIFWVAYDMFEKAGNFTEMSNVKKYFPLKEELFFSESALGAKLGEKIQVGCWINETTTVRSKD